MNEEKWFSKEIDDDRFYTVIGGLFTQVGPPFVLANMQIVPNGMFWSLLLYKIIELGQEYSANPIQKECNNNEEYATAYGAYNIETTMFVLGLMTLSWLKINIKKKTENGQYSYDNEIEPVQFIASEMQKEGLDVNNEENLDSYLNTKFM